jgi:DNA-binding MarR family transcriptional regulator
LPEPAPEVDPTPPVPIGALFRFGLHEIRNRISTGVREAGFEDVRPAHVTLFRWPGPDGRRPGEVAADVQISKQRVNDLLRDLERHGYLSLERDRHDNRARIIRLTPRGRRLHQIAVGVHAQIEAEWSQAIGPRRYKQLRRALDDLIVPADRRTSRAEGT